MLRTAVRFRSTPPKGLQWLRRGIRKMTEACSVRAKTQTLTKSLVSPVKQHQLLLDLKGDGVISALSTK